MSRANDLTQGEGLYRQLFFLVDLHKKLCIIYSILLTKEIQ
jgi:hypothetical protein